jgi:hypothetical protein
MRVLVLLALLSVACGQTTVPKCSASNCMGCCTGAGDCLGGNTFADCGKAGDICATCDTGQACVGGVCGAPPADAGCTLASCGGCCDPNQVCHPGGQDAFCGHFANACVDCTDAGFSCEMNACI